MRIGAHIRDDDPIAAAAELNAEVVQFFLADPQGWKVPTEHPQARQLAGGGLEIYVHSPYVLYGASLIIRFRIPSR